MNTEGRSHITWWTDSFGRIEAMKFAFSYHFPQAVPRYMAVCRIVHPDHPSPSLSGVDTCGAFRAICWFRLPAKQRSVQAFLAFIGGGLATAATVMASLLTWQHNKRAERQLELDTVVKGLESLPDGEARVAGAIATMVLLGQQPVAMRVLVRQRPFGV
jgi:hypothetical protein